MMIYDDDNEYDNYNNNVEVSDDNIKIQMNIKIKMNSTDDTY